MKTKLISILCGSVLLAGTTVLGTSQIKQIIKVLGVNAAVRQFAPDINKAINRLSNYKDTPQAMTKVVTIYSIGISKSSAIGAAQVSGTKEQLAKVESVASPETELFGREIRIRALIPIEGVPQGGSWKRVPGVAVTGIVDLKL